jgi:transcription termination factor Rho
MEVHLDRGLVDRRIFPSINVERSGTRKEELLYHPDELNKIVLLRRALTGVPPVEAMELLLGKLKKTNSNIEFLIGMAVG